MAVKEYKLKYGSSKVAVSLEEQQVADVIHIADYPPLENPREVLRRSFYNPIGCKPLDQIIQPGQTVSIIVNDSTRVANTSLIVEVLLEELNKLGVPDENICFVFALGSHRVMTDEEMIHELGEEAFRRIRCYNSDCTKDDEFKYFGTTSFGTPVWFNKHVVDADHIICTGSILHHFFSGFGGGRKAMLPGVSRKDTITANHSHMPEPGAKLGKLAGNPVYEDQIEGVKMCPPSFLINVVLDASKRFLKVFSGHYITAHTEACEFVNQVYGAEIAKEADIVIASCGGYPKDINIYQMQKTMDNAWCAVRQGGVVIMLAECIEGSGSPTLEKAMREGKNADTIEKKLRDNFVLGGHKAFAIARLGRKAEFILVSALDPDFARMMLFTPAANIEEALELAHAKVGKDASVILMPDGSYTVPRLKE